MRLARCGEQSRFSRVTQYSPSLCALVRRNQASVITQGCRFQQFDNSCILAGIKLLVVFEKRAARLVAGAGDFGSADSNQANAGGAGSGRSTASGATEAVSAASDVAVGGDASGEIKVENESAATSRQKSARDARALDVNG